MPIMFYPQHDELDNTSSLKEKLEVLLEAAQNYKAFVLDPSNIPNGEEASKKRQTPRDLKAVFNWDEIAKLLRAIRDLPEANQSNKTFKAEHLTKLAEIYEVLRGAKMAKLEAVRIALINEANQLKPGSSQVA